MQIIFIVFQIQLVLGDFLHGNPSNRKEGWITEFPSKFLNKPIIGEKSQNLLKRFQIWQNEEIFPFQEWNYLRSNDGVLCRNDMDCKWIDENLNCLEPETFYNFEPNVSKF